jgi:hypothetical protein
MIKVKTSTKIDMSGLDKLRKQLKQNSVNVGYINSKEHWMNEGDSVGEIASHLHYWSAWKDTFMLSESKASQVEKIVASEMDRLGSTSVTQWASSIGNKAAKQIAKNIDDVQHPPNKDEWVKVKGFNDPLEYGSRDGEEPNLISELTYRVGDI